MSLQLIERKGASYLLSRAFTKKGDKILIVVSARLPSHFLFGIVFLLARTLTFTSNTFFLFFWVWRTLKPFTRSHKKQKMGLWE